MFSDQPSVEYFVPDGLLQRYLREEIASIISTGKLHDDQRARRDTLTQTEQRAFDRQYALARGVRWILGSLCLIPRPDEEANPWFLSIQEQAVFQLAGGSRNSAEEIIFWALMTNFSSPHFLEFMEHAYSQPLSPATLIQTPVTFCNDAGVHIDGWLHEIAIERSSGSATIIFFTALQAGAKPLHITSKRALPNLSVRPGQNSRIIEIKKNCILQRVTE